MYGIGLEMIKRQARKRLRAFAVLYMYVYKESTVKSGNFVTFFAQNIFFHKIS